MTAQPEWIRLPPHAREVLPNGLTVIVVERRSLPLVSIRLVLRAGSSHDPAELPGLAAFTARLLRHGAGQRDARQFADDLDFIGGSVGASVGLDQMTVDGEFTTETWSAGLELYRDALFAPTFDESEIERERRRGIAEITQSHDDPEHVADRAFQYYLFGEGHPYGHPAEGTIAAIERLRREALVRFHAEAMVPDGSVLVVVGDVPAAETLATLRATFGAWKGTGRVPGPPSPAPRISGRRCVLVHDEGSGQVQYRTGNVGVERRTPHFHALLVANTAFGGGFTSRLMREIRVNRGLTYGIGSRFLTAMAPGPFMISSFTRNACIAEMHEVVTSLAAAMHAKGPTDEEVAAARAYLLGMQVRRLETSEALAGAIAETEIFSLGLQSITDFRRDVEAVDRDAAARAMAACLPGDDLLTVLVGDRASVEPVARTFGDLTVVNADFAERSS